MPANVRHQREAPFPTRGMPGGWRDRWEEDDTPGLRATAMAQEKAMLADARKEGRRWRAEFKRQPSAPMSKTADNHS